MRLRRLPLIRHIRYFYHTYHLARHNRTWFDLGYFPNPRDRIVLQKIWDGDL